MQHLVMYILYKQLEVAGQQISAGTENANNGTTTLLMRNYDSTLVDAGDVQNMIRMTGRYWSGSTSQLVETRIESIHQLSNGNGGSALGFRTQTGGDGPVEHMRLDRDGLLGVGTTVPSAYNAHGRNLVVAGGGNVGITIDGASSSSCSICFADGTSSTASIAGKIEYSHGDNHFEFRTDATERMRLTSNGDLHVDADIIGFSTTISDERLKDKIITIDSALDKIKNLKGVTFYWNSGSKKGKKDW